MTDPNSLEPKKSDLINILAKNRNWESYLEFCTANTGFCYSKIDRQQLKICHRMMYRCPDNYNDGYPVEYQSNDLEISSALTKLKNSGIKYDLIMCDPWHEYHTSIRDIQEIFEVLKPGGVLIVHDCLPIKEEWVSPTPVEGAWCGVTYQAFLDFVLTNQHRLNYSTVDIDYGCGVIYKKKFCWPLAIYQVLISLKIFLPSVNLEIVNQWIKISKENKGVCFFTKKAKELLNLISFEAFQERENRK